MEFDQLRLLDALARLGTLAAAAESLHVSQSALSRSLRRLEKDLGCGLFERQHNSIALNDQGRLALVHARQMLADERRMRRDLAELSRRARTVRVASVAPAPTWHLSSLILSAYPTTILEPDVLPEVEVWSRLVSGDCDLAVTSAPSTMPTVESRQLMTEHLLVVVPKGHALHEWDALSFADIDGECFLVFGHIGLWADIHEVNLPHASFVVQSDRTLFLQQVATTDLLSFATDASRPETSRDAHRHTIPLVDEAARVTFYLSVRSDADERIKGLFRLVERAV